MDNTHRNVNADGEKPTKPHSYTKFRFADSKRNSLPQGRAHHLVFQCQIITPDNIHMSNIIQIEAGTFNNVYYIYLHRKTMTKEAIRLKESNAMCERVWKEEKRGEAW